jgi:hypothetical protein
MIPKQAPKITTRKIDWIATPMSGELKQRNAEAISIQTNASGSPLLHENATTRDLANRANGRRADKSIAMAARHGRDAMRQKEGFRLSI